eukprot:4590378-Alexandrium_andersonii.AAC.1
MIGQGSAERALQMILLYTGTSGMPNDAEEFQMAPRPDLQQGEIGRQRFNQELALAIHARSHQAV